MSFQKKKRKKKERRKVGVSINRSRSWFYFTDIHNRLNKSRKYYLLKIARNNPSTVSYSFSCCATQRFLNGMAVGFVQLIFLSFFFFFFFFNKLNSPSPFENQRNIDLCIRFRGDISSKFPFDRISTRRIHEFSLLESLDPRDPIQGHSTTPPPGSHPG